MVESKCVERASIEFACRRLSIAKFVVRQRPMNGVLLNVFQYVIEEEQFADLPVSFDLQDLQNKLPGFLSEIRRRIGFSD